ncbi:hypothetical protein AD998_16055 [bacterium 336/3]|nr:hypothetical protein AD998_16055 [bacterium 336/3]
MLVNDIIGKSITNIHCVFESEPYGLDMSEIFIELDNHLMIDIPFSLNDTIWIKELPDNAKPVFEEKILKKPPKIISYFLKLLNYNLYHEYKKDELKENVLNKKIVGLILEIDGFHSDKSFLLLENDFLITEIIAAPHGTSRAGLHIFKKNKDEKFSHS